jgi:anti-sigma B factor antagonist
MMSPGDSAELRIDTEFVDGAVVLRLAGQLREGGADDLRQTIDDLIGSGHLRLVFDMTEISFISSVGLGQMMRAYRAAVDKGYVRIVNPQPLVEEVFRFTKLHTLIAIFPTVEAAVEAD